LLLRLFEIVDIFLSGGIEIAEIGKDAFTALCFFTAQQQL